MRVPSQKHNVHSHVLYLELPGSCLSFLVCSFFSLQKRTELGLAGAVWCIWPSVTGDDVLRGIPVSAVFQWASYVYLLGTFLACSECSRVFTGHVTNPLKILGINTGNALAPSRERKRCVCVRNSDACWISVSLHRVLPNYFIFLDFIVFVFWLRKITTFGLSLLDHIRYEISQLLLCLCLLEM